MTGADHSDHRDSDRRNRGRDDRDGRRDDRDGRRSLQDATKDFLQTKEKLEALRERQIDQRANELGIKRKTSAKQRMRSVLHASR